MPNLDLLKTEERNKNLGDQTLHKLRSSLVDYMFYIGSGCSANKETMHQAVGFLDMALSLGLDKKHTPQVLGIFALQVASEFLNGEVLPNIYDQVYDASGDEFDEAEVSTTAKRILKIMNFNWRNYITQSKMEILLQCR